MNRRRFLECIGAGLAAAPAAEAAAPFADDGKQVRVAAITEPGGQHLNNFVKALAACPGVEQIALADRSGEYFAKGKELLGPRAASCRTFTDYREMLQAVKPDLVVLALEPVSTPPVIAAALEAGSHVLAEKPPCARLEDFEPLAALARSKQRHLMVALANRMSPAVVKARELVETGQLGKLYGASLHLVADQTRLKSAAYRQSWPASRRRGGGGKLIYHGIHYLDLVQYVARDRIRRVTGFTANVGGQPIEVEDAVVLSLEFAGGMLGTLNAGYYLDRGYSTSVHLWGAHGWVRFDPGGGTPLEWRSTRPGAPEGVQSFAYPQEPDVYQRLLEAAVGASRGVGRAPIDGAESLAVLRVIFAAYRAAETGTTQET
jgi:predicted dehydrogenase